MMMSSAWMLLVAAALGCSVVHGMIEDYDQKWLDTMAQIPVQPSDEYTTQQLSCKGIQFNTEDGKCSPTMPGKATSVHLLTPADIYVIAAIGDSITAGQGAISSNIFDSPTKQARGVSWSIGGDSGNHENCATLANILMNFNPNLKGASTGSGDEFSSGAHYNRAVSAAESSDIMAQAEELIRELKSDLTPDEFENEWKLVTLWIGGNDLCQCCTNPEWYSASNYVQRIKETLLYLKANMPKTLVNIPQALDVTKIVQTNGLICGIVQWFACDCASKDSTKAVVKQYMDALENELMTEELLDDPEDDFAIVMQPFFKGVDVPRTSNGNPDMSFFAPDCFHMSVKGHRSLAAALWNDMIKSVAEKEETWETDNPVLECPESSHPYFYTSKTEAILMAQAAAGGGFNSESLPESEQHSDNEEDGWGIGQIFGVAIGSAATAYVVAVMVGVAIGGTVWLRRRRQVTNKPDNEKIPLVKRR